MADSSRYLWQLFAGQRILQLAFSGFCLTMAMQAYGQDSPRPGLDARIVSMPKVERKLEVIQNRSQLVKTAKRVTRMAIADPTVIDIAPFEENEFAIIGAALGTTTLTLWFEDDNDPLIYEITTVRDPNIEEQIRIDYGKLERKIAVLFPNSKVYLIPLHEKLVVKGQARDAAEAARILQIIRGEYLDDYGGLGGPGGFGGRGNDFGGDDRLPNEDDLFSGFLVNMLQVPGEFQVMLHVTIAELNRSELRRMGVDMTYLIADGRHVISSAISGGVPTLSGVFENGDISVLISALASNGTAKILSRPSLTTLSGHPATFLAGGEFAVPTIVGVGGAQAQTTQFRGFGTSMVVVPTVVDGDLIRLRISPEFSRIDPNNSVNGVPGLSSRRVNTTVELREGQSIVLGGLLSRQQSTEVTRIPLVGEIPVIGPLLFNTKRANEDELELLVLVTPELVRPMDPDEVPPVPGYYVTHPNDAELYRYAMTEGAPDTEVYQLAPLGNHVGEPTPVGLNIYNPSPATPQYGPIPQANQPSGVPAPAPWMNQNSRYQGDPNAFPGDLQGMNGGMEYQGGDPTMYQQGMQPPMSMNQNMMAPQGSYPSNGQDMYYGQPMQNPSMAPPSMQSPMYPNGQPIPGYQNAPMMQGPGQMMPSPDPGAQSYRGGQPTAAYGRQVTPAYGQQRGAGQTMQTGYQTPQSGYQTPRQ
ncbi:type II and III secretion system protein family protein [Rubinisphaera margarita]|uniref:type II and III secretion system protein family protein n=1 Tax=Rubinisphaera margarita TaxID=2909586 RepID=UPI001EE7C4C7|nr:pilus assembly protein N-terminal domain-containing protein [Rubinisphaera margarita]MCG6158548.1 pilus assembly protein N-terminal domain-containing protein [Rubinisphaera margarita]